MITVSVVSHRHGTMLPALLEDLSQCREVTSLILTHNVPEPEIDLPVPLAASTTVCKNETPMGFAANHNAAFRLNDNPFFCVLNPDIRLEENPFPALLPLLDGDVGLVAPAVIGPDGRLEDSVRRFPTPFGLLNKAIGGGDGRYVFSHTDEPFAPEWVAGMFMLFRSQSFEAVDGFDTGYFLYYEDVDLCLRLWQEGIELRAHPGTKVVHDARRASRRNLRFLRWHAGSMTRFFRKHVGRFPKVPEVSGGGSPNKND